MESSLDTQAQKRARLLRSFSFGLSLLGSVYVALAIFVLHMPWVALLTLAATLGILLAPLTLRFTGSQRAAAYQLTGSILLPILITSGMTVGLPSPALSWLAAIPMVAMALVDRRSGILWAGITLAGLAMLVVLERLHLLPNAQMPPAQLRAAATLTWTGLIGVVLAMALLCDKLRSDVTRAIAQAHQDLSEEHATLAERRDHLMAQVNNVTHRINNPLQYIMSNRVSADDARPGAHGSRSHCARTQRAHLGSRGIAARCGEASRNHGRADHFVSESESGAGSG